MSSTKKLAAGERIESRCRRCNDVTGHIIVAMVGGEIYKVECQACRSIHKFHSPNPVPKTAAEPRRRTTTPGQPRAPKSAQAERAGSVRQSVAIEQAWQEALNRHIGSAKPYAMNATFEKGDLVDHPSFGTGIVQSVEAPNKMDVLFRDGIRSLRCVI